MRYLAAIPGLLLATLPAFAQDKKMILGQLTQEMSLLGFLPAALQTTAPTRLKIVYLPDSAQSVSADNANYFTGMLGADFQMEQRLNRHMSLLPHLYTGLSYDFVSDDNNSRVTLPNATGYNVVGERLHRLAFEVGAGVTARLYNSVEVVLGYEGSFRQDYNAHTGTLKLRYLF